MKTCKGCNQTKALTEFHKESKGRNGLKSRCKVCKNAYFRKYRQNNLEKKRASQRKSQQRPEYKKKDVHVKINGTIPIHSTDLQKN